MCCCCCCSAPEILLAIVESILRLGKPAGELGPSTIVGSAAYNLLMISAVCTMALPAGEDSSSPACRVSWAIVYRTALQLWPALEHMNMPALQVYQLAV
jgi:solute carrier family 8 (sodium/calcium exchanger)